MVRGASNLPAVARFPAAFYLLIQLGFVRTLRLHLEPAEESVLHTIQEETAASENRKKNFGKDFFVKNQFLYVFYPVDPSFCRNNYKPPTQKLVSTGILPYENYLQCGGRRRRRKLLIIIINILSTQSWSSEGGTDEKGEYL